MHMFTRIENSLRSSVPLPSESVYIFVSYCGCVFERVFYVSLRAVRFDVSACAFFVYICV